MVQINNFNRTVYTQTTNASGSASSAGSAGTSGSAGSAVNLNEVKLPTAETEAKLEGAMNQLANQNQVKANLKGFKVIAWNPNNNVKETNETNKNNEADNSRNMSACGYAVGADGTIRNTGYYFQVGKPKLWHVVGNALFRLATPFGAPDLFGIRGDYPGLMDDKRNSNYA